MLTLWDPSTNSFRTSDGNQAQDTPLIQLNILIELRVISFILSVMNQDVLKDDVEKLRADMAVDTPNFVTGASGPMTS